ncbi:hypothetical protein NL676_008826 [Syzygium grande]|nr:hypothetical protein NL676_008826 [Syzygium grande]
MKVQLMVGLSKGVPGLRGCYKWLGLGSLGHTAKRRSRIGALAGITGSLKPSWRLAKLEHNLQRKLNVTAKNVGCLLVALAMRREQIRSTDLA